MMNTELYDLTNPQKSIWLTEQFYKGSSVNNICGTVLIDEKVNFDLLCTAINIFIKDNDSFRIHIKIDKNGNVKQYFSNYIEKTFEVVDVANNDELIALENQMATTPFDVIENDLFDIEPFRFPNGKGGFIVNASHLVADACTASLVASKIMNIYSSLLRGEQITEPATSYVNYINSEKEYLTSPKFEKDKEYWNSQFDSIPEFGTIPSLKSSTVESSTACRQLFKIDSSLVEDINLFCKDKKISLFNFFMGIYALYIGRVSNLDNFVLGTPILNRTTFTEKTTPGMFISTVPFKFSLSGDDTFVQYAQKIGLDSLSMFRHQKYPYQNILEHIRKTNPSQPNLYDILISYQNSKTNRTSSDIPYMVRWTFNQNVADSMQIHIFDMNDEGELNIAYDYRLSKYNKEDITDIHNRILYIIEQILSNNEILLSDIDITTPAEKSIILNIFNNTSVDFKLNSSDNIISFIELSAQKNPESIAIEDNFDSITYKELIIRVKKLSNYLLHNFNIKEKTNIGILTNKDIDTIVAILAILKINCTYVPIDPNYPVERIEYMISNSKIDTILINNTNFSHSDLSIIDVEYKNYCNESDAITAKFDYNINNNLYIIFTSGSTGNPKGVSISHKNIINLVMYEKNKTNIFSNTSRILQFATMSFDVSYQEIFSSLVLGSCLVLIDDNVKKDRVKLCNYIIDKRIDTLFIPPKYLLLLLENNDKFDMMCKTLKNVITAGEQLIITNSIMKMISSGVVLHNHYGPAETHVCTTYTIDSSEKIDIKPSIGTPISNSKIYIMDSTHKLCPIGVVGNLYISGDCVGNGYVNNSQLTNERFMVDPFSSESRIMYNSGDLARYDYDGNIYYVGRSDFQVKVNGFRIELEEVELGILKLSYVESAYVTIIQNDMGKNILVAFIKLSNYSNELNIRNDLAKFLPKYMIPNIFYKVDTLTLNHNGKVDKKYLIEHTQDFEIISNSSNSNCLPRNDLEKLLLAAFKRILEIDKLSINDNFFDFGGDSLSAIALQAECSKNGIYFNTQELYDNPTVSDLSKHLNASHSVELDKKVENINLTEQQTSLKETNNVFLTGSNGFLGIHVLNDLLKTNNIIYCLVRSTPSKTSSQRLLDIYNYYFNIDISDFLNSNLYVIDGDLSKDYFGLDKEQYYNLADKIDIVINCAASVKHYATRKYNYTNNVVSTKKLLDFSEYGNCLFNHISTVGIAGNDLVDTNNCIKSTFTEDDLYIKQAYKSNVYVETKFEAEELIIDRIKSGKILANILRVGNLTNRYSDNKFQIDSHTNAFQNKMKSIANLGVVPERFSNYSFDFTPVDMCATAIIKLVFNNTYNKIYHVLNHNVLSFNDIVQILAELNITIKVLPDNQISNIIRQNISASQYESYKWILNDLVLNNHKRINIDSSKTQKVLKSLGFDWDTIDTNYYKRVFENMLKGDGKN